MPTKKTVIPTKSNREKQKQEANEQISKKLDGVYKTLKECEKIADEAQISFYCQGLGYGMGATYFPPLKVDTARRDALEKLSYEERELLGLPLELDEIFVMDETERNWKSSDVGWISSSDPGC